MSRVTSSASRWASRLSIATHFPCPAGRRRGWLLLLLLLSCLCGLGALCRLRAVLGSLRRPGFELLAFVLIRGHRLGAVAVGVARGEQRVGQRARGLRAGAADDLLVLDVLTLGAGNLDDPEAIGDVLSVVLGNA